MSHPKVFTKAEFEHDARWTAVDDYTLKNLHPNSRPNTAALHSALQNSIDNGLPDISCYPQQGKFLALLCRLMRVSHALEIGTLGGYSAIWLASENPEMKVTSIEVNPDHARVARDNISHAGLSSQVEVIVGAGLDILPQLAADIDSGKREKFGFVFIDADKQNNWAYYQMATKMTLSGGGIYVDNVVRKGQVADETDPDPRIHGCRKLVEEVGKDEKTDGVVLQTVASKNYDGFMLAVVK